jgi:O-antigen ligase
MPLLVAVALVTFLSCALGGLDRDAARALTASAHGLVMLGAVALPRSRQAIFELLKRFSLPAGLFAALIMLGAIMSGAFFIGAADTPYRAEQAMVALAGVGFFFLASASASTAAGRNRMVNVLLWVPLAIALMTLLDWFDGRGDFFGLVAPNAENRVAGPFATPNEAATVFALFVVFAAFAAVDELTRMPQQGGPAPPTLTRRLFLPTASLVASLNMLVLTGSRAGIAAGVAGLAAYFFLAWRRGQKGRAGPRIVPLAAGVVGLIALVVAATSGAGALRRYAGAPGDRDYYVGMSKAAMDAWAQKPVFGHGLGSYDVIPAGEDGAPFDLLRLLAEGGIVGVALLLGGLGVLLWRLWRADDHGRKPSRGFALAAGLLTVAVVHGAATAALSAPAAASVLAALMGVAVAYIDPLGTTMKVKATARTRVLS